MAFVRELGAESWLARLDLARGPGEVEEAAEGSRTADEGGI